MELADSRAFVSADKAVHMALMMLREQLCKSLASKGYTWDTAIYAANNRYARVCQKPPRAAAAKMVAPDRTS